MPPPEMNEEEQKAYDEALRRIDECRRLGGEELVLAGLSLTRLPPAIWRLSNITWLNLNDNRLATLPAEIGHLVRLQVLALSNNRLTLVPVELGEIVALEYLLLDGNSLNELPQSLQQLPRLVRLYLHGNPALGLPAEALGPTWERVNKGEIPANPRDILDFYFSQRSGPRRPLNEVKVLVVGESEVGKTSLIRQLRGESYNPKEDKTHGIERHRVPMECGRLGEVRLNVWDFGGQDIMHATHQFFLTHRSVYLLVLDSRQNERQSRIDYWLRLIASYGGQSPVIVVCNKSDQQVMQLNWTGLQREYPQIKAFAKEVSCYHHEGVDRRKGLEELKEQIAHAVAHEVAEVDKPILEKWLHLKDELETDGRPYLTLEEYHKLAHDRGLRAPRDREVLLSLMHQLGSVLHFSEHAIFERDRQANPAPAQVEELNVLDPGWVTGAIYKLLNDPALIRAGGTMNRGDLRRSLAELPGARYPANKEDFIIAMMRRFEICFAFDGEADRWFLPDLLHKDEVDTGDWGEALGFRYQYRVLPGSVIGRLMVRLHGHIARHCLWRTGAKFNRDGCEALVRSEPEEARLDIFIRGGSAPQRREFLALFRGTLADIHRSFSDNLGVRELVPVPGQFGVYVGYQKLLLLEAKGTLLDAEEIDGKLIEVKVDEALNGVTERASRDEERQRLAQREQKVPPVLPSEPRTPDGPWRRSWTAVSLGSALAAGVVAFVLMKWENTTGRILIGVVAAVFVLMLSHNPRLRFRRLFQWALAGWMATNALGIAIAATWKNAEGEALLKWDGAVGWSFNAAFAIVVVVTGLLAWKEWDRDGQG